MVRSRLDLEFFSLCNRFSLNTFVNRGVSQVIQHIFVSKARAFRLVLVFIEDRAVAFADVPKVLLNFAI